jgi:hypothetical protein
LHTAPNRDIYASQGPALSSDCPEAHILPAEMHGQRLVEPKHPELAHRDPADAGPDIRIDALAGLSRFKRRADSAARRRASPRRIAAA